MILRKILKWDRRVLFGVIFLGNFVYGKGIMESLIGVLLLIASGMVERTFPGNIHIKSRILPGLCLLQ